MPFLPFGEEGAVHISGRGHLATLPGRRVLAKQAGWSDMATWVWHLGP